MKKTTLILFAILTIVTFKSFGQKLVVNKLDDGKINDKQTSWESLALDRTSLVNAHYSFWLIGDSTTLRVRLMRDKVFAINSDQQMILKLSNGETVTVMCEKYAITCNGCGAVGWAGSQAEGLEVSYGLDKDQIAKLKAAKIIGATVYTVTDSFELNIKDKDATKFQASLNLL